MEVLPESKTIKRCTRKHEFIGIHVTHDKEWKLPRAHYLEMESAELGKPATVNTNAEPFRKYFESFASKQSTEIQELFENQALNSYRSIPKKIMFNLLGNFLKPEKKDPLEDHER